MLIMSIFIAMQMLYSIGNKVYYYYYLFPSVCLSVCPSVRPSVRPSVTLFDNVPVIVSSWNLQELLPLTNVMSMQKAEVKGQGHKGHDPI